jgi:hypothetical protein
VRIDIIAGELNVDKPVAAHAELLHPRPPRGAQIGS